ncbi:MAG TPA: cysteine desulfurase, partial [Paraburkholderia sp.]|nr:cysteine desulfurase [Paraburkholderia sp.]
MTIQTPTSNPLGQGVPHDIPQAAPAGLPDPATLARLATEFFTALPGTDPHASASPASALPFAAPELALVSNPAPAGSPLAGPGGTGTG